MNIVTFVAGLVTGLVIGRRRREAERSEPPPPEADPSELHRRKMEAILRGEWTPTPSERRAAEAWREAREERDR